MKLKSIRILATALAVVGLNSSVLHADETPQCIVTEPVGDPNSTPCLPDLVYGAKDALGQFAADLKNSEDKNFDLVMFGDSVTENWGSTGVEGSFSSLKIDPSSDGVFCMGIGGNRTQNMIYRCENGALDKYTTKYFTLLAGVNNIYQRIIDSGEDPDDPKDVAEAVRKILNMMLAKHPESKVLLMPILPYAQLYEQNYYSGHIKGIRVREKTEEINDIIIKFVDNKRVFWVDVREKFLNPDGLPNFALFGGAGGEYDPYQALHPNTRGAYTNFNTAVTKAMLKYLNVPAGTAQCTEPSLGLVTSFQSGYGTSVTINLTGIYLGTDANAVPVTKYSIAYELDGGARTTVLSNQTTTRNSFVLSDLALGAHTLKVYVTTADNKVLTRNLEFTRYDGWVAEALPTDASKIRTDGTLKFAYALEGNYTVNTVPFVRVDGNSIDNANLTWNPGIPGPGGTPTGVASGDYQSMLKKCWWSNAGTRAVTLKNLTPGHNYLVQIIACRILDNMNGHIWVDESFHESYESPFFIKVCGADWPCGGSLTGVFTADTSTTKTFTLASDGNWAVNAIQVRDLGASGTIPDAPVVVTPTYQLTVPTKTGLTLVSVTTNGVNVAAVGGTYPILKGTVVKVTFAAVEGYEISGNDYVSFTMNSTKTLTDYPSVKSTASGDDPEEDDPAEDDPSGGDPVVPVAGSWSAEPLTASETSVCTTGTLVYAYCNGYPNNYETNLINGVAFVGFSDNGDFAGKQKDVSVSPAFGAWNNGFNDEGVSGNYGNLLKSGFWTNGASDTTYTLKNLTVGKTYLVQLFVHWNWAGSNLSATIGGKTVYAGGTGWTYGGSLIGVFTATGTEQSFTVSYTGYTVMNGIQVRQLDDSAPVTPPEDDPEEDDPVTPPVEVPPAVFTLTVPAAEHLTLDSVKTNGLTVAAIAAGQYAIVSNTEVKVTFTVDSDYEFTGDDYVTVKVEKDLTLATFPAIQAKVTPPEDDPAEDDPVTPVEAGWTAAPLAADGSTISTDGTLLYAYRAKFSWDSGVKSTINGVDFQKVNDLSTVTDFSVDATMTFADYLGEESASNVYGSMMPQGFRNGTKGEYTYTLKGLTAGKAYLVQLLIHRSGQSSCSACPSEDTSKIVYFGGTGWTFGGSLMGVFTAAGTTHSFKVTYSNDAVFNAIQVREVEVGGGDEGLTDWPTVEEITDAMTAADFKITEGGFADATPAELRKLAAWAKAKSIPFDGTEKNGFSFDANGNPLNDLSKAYLFNCAAAELSVEQAAFKFAAFESGTVPTIDGAKFNGTVVIEGKASLNAGVWSTADAGAHRFFRARLKR